MRLALYQPDIAQNVGSLVRLTACMATPLDIIEPCGFPFDLKRIKQSVLDYAQYADITRHTSWEKFLEFLHMKYSGARLILLTTKASQCYHHCRFEKNDVLLMGRESAGVPEAVMHRADVRLRIPMAPQTRSLNVAQAATIVLSEGLRQTESFPS